MTVATEPRIIKPQPGPQTDCLSTPADIAIIGGAAGGGKTWALLLEALRHAANPEFGVVMFRRTYPQIMNEGGLWDESEKLYPLAGAVPRRSNLDWVFPGGAKIKFAHMQHEDDRNNWKGARIALIEFDQLEDFTARQFFFLLGRNTSMCGVKPYLRASCNPLPREHKVGGWLRQFIDWWINPETGYPIQERSGVIRWFVRDGDDIAWADTEEELRSRFPESDPKSLTFIPAKLTDNPALMKADPGYIANLQALPLVERERLLYGNWNVLETAGNIFNRAWFPIVDAAPSEAERLRYWDKAGTEGAGDYSAGVRIARAGGIYYIEHVIRGQWSSGQRNIVMQQTAAHDRPEVPIVVEQEGGSGGKESAEISIQSLAGYMVRVERPTSNKVSRAGPLAAQAEAGNVKLVRGHWNEDFLAECHNFPEGKHDDQVDAAAGAFNKLALKAPALVITGPEPMNDERKAELDEERKREAEEAVRGAIRGRGAFFPGDV
jgi:predicted phage terminase large subunit-like protein